jgi:hypothetical protein
MSNGPNTESHEAQVQAAHDEPLAVTIDSARRMLGGVSRSSIYRALDRGELTGTIVCGRRLILTASIKAALDNGVERGG